MSGPGGELAAARQIYSIKLQEIDLDRQRAIAQAQRLAGAQQEDAVNDAN